MSFNVFDFQFRSLCGIARIPYAAGGLEQQVVELPLQNYSVAKVLKKARLQGPLSGCQNQPKTGYVRRYLQSNQKENDLAKFLRLFDGVKRQAIQILHEPPSLYNSLGIKQKRPRVVSRPEGDTFLRSNRLSCQPRFATCAKRLFLLEMATPSTQSACNALISLSASIHSCGYKS